MATKTENVTILKPDHTISKEIMTTPLGDTSLLRPVENCNKATVISPYNNNPSRKQASFSNEPNKILYKKPISSIQEPSVVIEQNQDQGGVANCYKLSQERTASVGPYISRDNDVKKTFKVDTPHKVSSPVKTQLQITPIRTSPKCCNVGTRHGHESSLTSHNERYTVNSQERRYCGLVPLTCGKTSAVLLKQQSLDSNVKREYGKNGLSLLSIKKLAEPNKSQPLQNPSLDLKKRSPILHYTAELAKQTEVPLCENKLAAASPPPLCGEHSNEHQPTQTATGRMSLKTGPLRASLNLRSPLSCDSKLINSRQVPLTTTDQNDSQRLESQTVKFIIPQPPTLCTSATFEEIIDTYNNFMRQQTELLTKLYDRFNTIQLQTLQQKQTTTMEPYTAIKVAEQVQSENLIDENNKRILTQLRILTDKINKLTNQSKKSSKGNKIGKAHSVPPRIRDKRRSRKFYNNLLGDGNFINKPINSSLEDDDKDIMTKPWKCREVITTNDPTVPEQKEHGIAYTPIVKEVENLNDEKVVRNVSSSKEKNVKLVAATAEEPMKRNCLKTDTQLFLKDLTKEIKFLKEIMLGPLNSAHLTDEKKLKATNILSVIEKLAEKNPENLNCDNQSLDFLTDRIREILNEELTKMKVDVLKALLPYRNFEKERSFKQNNSFLNCRLSSNDSQKDILLKEFSSTSSMISGSELSYSKDGAATHHARQNNVQLSTLLEHCLNLVEQRPKIF